MTKFKTDFIGETIISLEIGYPEEFVVPFEVRWEGFYCIFKLYHVYPLYITTEIGLNSMLKLINFYFGIVPYFYQYRQYMEFVLYRKPLFKKLLLFWKYGANPIGL